MSVYAEMNAEADRAHTKHGDTSMRAQPVDALLRLAILLEEVGEVAKEFNEARHRGDGVDRAALRKELIQVGAMAADWAVAIDQERRNFKMNATMNDPMNEVRALLEEARRLEADARAALSDASYKLVRADNCRRQVAALKDNVNLPVEEGTDE